MVVNTMRSPLAWDAGMILPLGEVKLAAYKNEMSPFFLYAQGLGLHAVLGKG